MGHELRLIELEEQVQQLYRDSHNHEDACDQCVGRRLCEVALDLYLRLVEARLQLLRRYRESEHMVVYVGDGPQIRKVAHFVRSLQQHGIHRIHGVPEMADTEEDLECLDGQVLVIRRMIRE